MLPVPRVPDGAHHGKAILHREQLDNQGTAAIMPDNGIAERFHKTVLDEFLSGGVRQADLWLDG